MSGKAAAEAILTGGDRAASYRRFLAATFGGFHAPAAALHATTLPRPRILSAVTRTLTFPSVARLISDAWALYWNDLVDGAQPGWATTKAAAIGRMASVATAAARTRKRVEKALEAR